MTTHTEIELCCPACGHEFQSRTWMSTNVMARETDFRPIACGFSPLPLYIHTCSQCGYSGSPADFQPETVVSPELAERVRNELGPAVQDGIRDTAMQYEFSARIAEWRGDDPESIAYTWLRAAWCCVETGPRDHEEKYRRHAIKFLKAALEVEDLILPEKVPVITYLIGELYRRVGEVDIARSWFDRVIAAGGKGEDAEMAIKYARRQRDNPDDMMDHE